MARSTQLRMVLLKVPQIGLRAFQDELLAVKLDFLLWGWNWVCPEMIREWLREKNQPPRGYRPHPERWQVSDWEQVLGRCAREEGDLQFKCESVQVTKEEKISFGALFKNCKSSKNGYKTRDYKDRMRRNVAVALLQILQPHRTTYMTSWQVGFVELALTGTPIHWARILWKATRQHAQEEKGGSINHLFPFLINFYQSMGCLTASERVQFPVLSRSNPGRYVKDVEIDTDTDEAPACTPPARLRADDEPRTARVPRKRKWDGEADQSQWKVPAAPVRSRANHEPSSQPKQKARKLILPASSADTGRGTVTKNSPSSGEDVSAGVLGRSADLPASKARTPSEEARRPLGQGRRHAAPANVPSAETQLEQSAADEGRKEETRVPSAQTPLAQAPSVVAVRAGEAGPPEASSSTLWRCWQDMERRLRQKKLRDPASENRQGFLRRQRSLTPKTTRDWRRRKWSRCELEERYNFMQEHCTILRKLQKAALQLRDDVAANAQRESEEQRAKIGAELTSERGARAADAVAGAE
ncbi:hypothetical protein AXG93_1976s1040 [Marchantia polymorpha subsp. ruderalis]|uniref:Uncharacterized protein n=1 Tax=Marchantia polymorpha subsp. ruderalis TaxID=1480154 RepID=A0A176VDM3_MARPO|nr:hypothetical protein AXG93_1976s1040 [Marchantia polymorpha subsp. ruderalis]